MTTVEDITLRESLCRLARFGANITDSHSCFVFLPALPSGSQLTQAYSEKHIVLAGYHSLSR
ncbi:MAG: hypothetical protein KDD62_04620, partial [Bdellovibrionales bacterium]|nr:hypothetical protein [Bdellovibrionales bacterium]